MIVDSQEKFERAIATAMCTDSSIYDSMETYLRNAEYRMKTTVLGEPLYSVVQDLPEELIRQMELVVSLQAFIEGIPFIDLILTETGFGIVSNTNLAPASKDRVDRLQKQAKDVLENAIDALIIELNASAFREKWAEGAAYEGFTSLLYWTAEELRTYAGKPDAHRSMLMEFRPHIAAAQQIIAKYISRDYLKELIEKRQKNETDGKVKLIMATLRQITGYLLQGMDMVADKELAFLVNLMECNPGDFPTYINSEEYKLKHSPVYENKKEDSVYFFG